MKFKISKFSKIKENSDVPDFGNQPYFIKKGEEMQAFFLKNGFPTELIKSIREGKK